MSAWTVTLRFFNRRNGRRWSHEATAWARTGRQAIAQVAKDLDESRTNRGALVGARAVPA